MYGRFLCYKNEYCKRITLYTYKILFQLHWPSCIESESPDGISYSGSHQIEKEIFLLLTIDYLKAIEKLGHFFSCQETPTLPFFLAIAAFLWSVVKCVLYWLICNVELHRYKKFYYWAAKKCWCGGDVYRVKQEMMLSRTWNFVLFCLAVTYYRANTNSPGPGVMKREEKLQRH